MVKEHRLVELGIQWGFEEELVRAAFRDFEGCGNSREQQANDFFEWLSGPGRPELKGTLHTVAMPLKRH
jgi:hypothetical protein